MPQAGEESRELSPGSPAVLSASDVTVARELSSLAYIRHSREALGGALPRALPCSVIGFPGPKSLSPSQLTRS